ncbi:hypothetical protein VTJ49DRAFT_7460 [Mycothermus thermophilus]|uniref:Uncharacterized protein n=1 Tax=Humicola insolens TaxID=85995 RepID=A0ABR3VGN6_HUMIN
MGHDCWGLDFLRGAVDGEGDTAFGVWPCVRSLARGRWLVRRASGPCRTVEWATGPRCRRLERSLSRTCLPALFPPSPVSLVGWTGDKDRLTRPLSKTLATVGEIALRLGHLDLTAKGNEGTVPKTAASLARFREAETFAEISKAPWVFARPCG